MEQQDIIIVFWDIVAGYNTTGYQNTAIGYQAGMTNTTGFNNTFIGNGADADGSNYSNASAFGNGAIVTGSNKIMMGSSAVTHIQGVVDFTTTSDGRFKTNVQENVKGMEFIKKLRPVTYQLDANALDDFLIQNMPDSIKQAHKAGMNFAVATGQIHSGFIAQEVELAAQQSGFNTSIVAIPANSNDLYGIAYAQIVVPLVKAVQEQNSRMDSLNQLIEQIDSVNKALQEQMTYIASNCCSSIGTGSRIDTNANKSRNVVSSWLAQNKPNPFTTETVIEYNVVEEGQASILVFDMNGKLLKTPPIKIPGKGTVLISGRELNSGMYYYALIVNGKEIDTKRMILTE